MEKDNGLARLVLIGGSAGSLEALLRIIPELPASLAFPIVIILHRKASSDNTLADLFDAKAALSIKEIEDKDSLRPGTVYLAPGDYHVLFERDGSLSLDASEKVCFSRPSIDVSFQSAAEVYGQALTCILLSGANADGTEGLMGVRACGGQAVVQLPASARTPFMPKHAIDRRAADLILDVPAMIELLRRL